MKKLLVSIFAMIFLIISSISTVFADGGSSNVNITFIVLTCIFGTMLIGAIIYYTIRAVGQKKKPVIKENIKIERDYESED